MNVFMRDEEYEKLLKKFELKSVYKSNWGMVDEGRLYEDAALKYLAAQYNEKPNTILYVEKESLKGKHIVSLSPVQGSLSPSQHDSILKDFMTANNDIKFEEVI